MCFPSYSLEKKQRKAKREKKKLFLYVLYLSRKYRAVFEKFQKYFHINKERYQKGNKIT